MKVKNKYSFKSAALFLKNHVSHAQFLIISSIAVGLIAGAAAVLLKTSVHYLHSLLSSGIGSYSSFFYLAFLPLAGIWLTDLIVHKMFNGNIGKGISTVLYEIAKKSSRIPFQRTFSHLLTSTVTVGFGGSAGLEAPIVITGAAVGSNYGKVNKLDYADKTILLAAGSAAGIAAVFNAPIAGVLFALEVLLADVTISAFIPLIIAAVTGALVSKIILQESILLHFQLQQSFDYFNVPYYLLLGVAAGFVSVYYSRMTHRIENLFAGIRKRILKIFLGGSILAGLYLFFPTLFGEGYESIKLLAAGEYLKVTEHSIFVLFHSNQLFLILFIAAVGFIKVIAAASTLSSGGNGGNFAPSLFTGAYLGCSAGMFINLFAGRQLPISNFTIVGMAGILSGVMYAPLTAVFLIAEITGSYDLIIPLMLVSAISFAIAKSLEPHSMDTKNLVKRGVLLTGDKDKSILSHIEVAAMLEKDIPTIKTGSTLGELILKIEKSKRNLVAVTGLGGTFTGLIFLDDIRKVMFKKELYNKIYVEKLIRKKVAIIYENESMVDVMRKFDSSAQWNLPVVKNTKFIGIVSKSSIFGKYRNRLIRQNLQV